MIRTESLTKYYGTRCAVRGLTFSIENHEIVGFLGLNGAGKTTTLRMLAGLLAPSSGRVEVDGQDMTADDARDVRWRIGFLPETPPLYEDMTVRQFLDFAARLHGYDEDHVGRRIDEVLELTATKPYAEERLANLSHGFRQRVGIAQAVIHDPALVILDEPTSGLDPVQIVEMRKLIRELKAQHTVLVSSHNLPEISQTCDRLMVMREGELVAVGSEMELRNQMGSGSHATIEIRGDAGRISELFANLAQDGAVSDWKVNERPDVQEVRAVIEGDALEKVARAIVEAGLGLRRLQPMANELESLFLQLTRGASS